jgi:hypothetical protein
MAKQYQLNDTAYICIVHSVYDFVADTWTPTNADATYPKITIIDANNITVANAQTMTQLATGKYSYRHKIVTSVGYIPPSGQWRGYIYTETGTYPNTKHFSFEVKD